MATGIVRWIKRTLPDPTGARVAEQARRWLGLETGEVRTAKVFLVPDHLGEATHRRLAEEGLRDAVLHEVALDALPAWPEFRAALRVARRPGVTDDEGRSAQRVLADLLDQPLPGHQDIFTQDLYLFTNPLAPADLERLGRELLANPLIERVEALTPETAFAATPALPRPPEGGQPRSFFPPCALAEEAGPRPGQPGKEANQPLAPGASLHAEPSRSPGGPETEADLRSDRLTLKTPLASASAVPIMDPSPKVQAPDQPVDGMPQIPAAVFGPRSFPRGDAATSPLAPEVPASDPCPNLTRARDRAAPTFRLPAPESDNGPSLVHSEYTSYTSAPEFTPAIPETSTRDEAPVAARPLVDPTVEVIPLPDRSDELLALSRARLLSLDLAEMEAIRDYYARPEVQDARRAAGLPPSSPTDAELEIIGQTWSEHCKHKEFAATIVCRDLDTGEETVVDSLFRTFIRRPTELLRAEQRRVGTDWLVKVFDDNAGVVKIDDRRLFVWKVETHNSPSALDPYGGALTGIVGNNRDPLGTGRGGARLLFNTDVLCFAPPDDASPLFPGQLPPHRMLQGVRRGIEDGGNKSGVPTVNGAIVFDPRYRAKPLVYCGTGAVLPATLAGRPAWEKEIAPGDLIVMAGGRVGRDGIHGATFSSAAAAPDSPASAVQIGSPLTQKMLSDFLARACADGLVKCCTDNGAGGLSSSVGELAWSCGGAAVQLEAVPLKYPGLRPWEIFLSESQERMTLVVKPDHWPALQALADRLEVEVSCLGQFTATGRLEVRFGDRPVADLELAFLHDGVPRKRLEAVWRAPVTSPARLPADLETGRVVKRLLRRWNICSRESVIRQYDHEVKGRTVIKPLMGPRGIAPQDAAVVRVDFSDFVGIAVANGICPRYGDLDAYAMSAGAFDEAVRQIIAVGGRLPRRDRADHRFWSGNDNFCVPDSVFDPETNPDGREKLGKLVRMCQALADLSLAYGVPMTSGKDSMKNDFRCGREKISVPPTVLYSLTARIDDVRRVTTAEFKRPGDLVFLVGPTRDELGGSELLDELGLHGGAVPQVRPAEARARYDRLSDAHEAGLLASCHDLSDGGLAVALAEAAFGGDLGADLELPARGLPTPVWLFSETHSRFLVTVPPPQVEAFTTLFGEDALRLGAVTSQPRLRLRREGRPVLDEPLADLFAAWNRDLEA